MVNDFSEMPPLQALDNLQEKLDSLMRDYGNGLLNSAQYNAIYRYYSEKRALIEHIIESNPDNPTWRAVLDNRQTDYLLAQFEARVLYYVVFRRGNQSPLLTDGKIPRKVGEQIIKLLHILWDISTWRKGVARKSLGDGMWLVLCIGEVSLTLTVFFLQPSNQQMNTLRELHQEFEQANMRPLQKEDSNEPLVFPQRALIEQR